MRPGAPTDENRQGHEDVKSISPVLTVRDVDASIAFYKEVLGFPDGDVLRMPNGTPVHGMVRWGSVAIDLSPEAMSPPVGDNRGDGVTLYVYVDADVDGYFQKVVGNGAEVVEDLKTQHWGDRTFTIADPDGYKLMFAQTVRQVSIEDMQKAMSQA